MTTIPLNKHAIDQVDLGPLGHYLDWNPKAKAFFLADAGQEHYKLLAYLSQQIHGEVADIGTLFGASALALSSNEESRILTIDIVRCIPQQDSNSPQSQLITPLSRANIKMLVASGQAVIPKIAQCNLVVLDVDPHDGIKEADFINRLINHQFKGILVADDIFLNKGMKHFWDNVPGHLKKLDVTHLGHSSGTGIIVFDPLHLDVCL
jgi:hypothetical protein